MVAASDFHSASPLPGRVPCAGSTSAVATTSAPAARATAAVRVGGVGVDDEQLVDQRHAAHPALAQVGDQPPDGRLLVPGRAGRR